MAPSDPKVGNLRLPPILRKQHPDPISGYSKASRGLSVLPRVNGIFTAIAISPDPSSRQCPDHSAFRAGRNLPDKEFRLSVLIFYFLNKIETLIVANKFGLYLVIAKQ